ncbi:hypothetical protein DNTS_021307 [Danionella cerebrum]|uniref:ILEI/PANDER domain-containing protein n=1 Tax=Danionella cerebrum TaxID=2873325 RepID=A0A553MMC3_9TELE|nr:hypothetical protein DNTS_021307 [Danionella translucida]
MRFAVALRAVALVLLLGFTWLLANSMLGGDGNSLIRMLFNEEPRPRKYKCGLSAPCPAKHLAFRLTSGAANVIGPKIWVNGDILEIRSFDMWAGEVSELLKFIRPLHEGTLVFVASFDDPATKLNDEARRLFEELGSTAAKELSFRDSWVFVGAKGIENKSPFEQRMKNSKNNNKYEGWPESLEMDGCIPLRAPLET